MRRPRKKNTRVGPAKRRYHLVDDEPMNFGTLDDNPDWLVGAD